MRKKSAEELALEGLTRADRPRRKGQVSAAAPRCPAGLSPAARAHWRRLATKLRRDGRLGDLDAGALADLCLCLAKRDQIEAVLEKAGLLMKGYRGDIVKNPLLAPLKLYRDQIARYERQFGLTPLAREQLSPPRPAVYQAAGAGGVVVWPEMEEVLGQREAPRPAATAFERDAWTKATGLPPTGDQAAVAPGGGTWVVADDGEGRQHELDSTQAS